MNLGKDFLSAAYDLAGPVTSHPSNISNSAANANPERILTIADVQRNRIRLCTTVER